MFSGLESLFHLTLRKKFELLVDMEDFSGNKVFARYSSFSIDPESYGYRLKVSGFTDGGAGQLVLAGSFIFLMCSFHMETLKISAFILDYLGDSFSQRQIHKDFQVGNNKSVVCSYFINYMEALVFIKPKLPSLNFWSLNFTFRNGY